MRINFVFGLKVWEYVKNKKGLLILKGDVWDIVKLAVIENGNGIYDKNISWFFKEYKGYFIAYDKINKCKLMVRQKLNRELREIL